MTEARTMARRLVNARSQPGVAIRGGSQVLRGPAAILGDGLYPHSFDEFVGQETAKAQLRTAIDSARKRGEPLGHVLLASGRPGIGKTALARIVAVELGAGFLELGGVVTAKDARPRLRQMIEGDVLFLDEIHRMVAQGKRHAEWLLQLLQDGHLVLPTGVEKLPRITVVAATTDAQKLPATILDRFEIQPVLTAYDLGEALQIAVSTAKQLGFGSLVPMPRTIPQGRLEDFWLARLCEAADRNPRRIGMLLRTLRDLALSGRVQPDSGGYDIATVLEWNGLSPDGLTQGQQDYLAVLFGYGGTASLATMLAALGEEVLTLTERTLIAKGYLMVTGRGRELTPLGTQRAQELLTEDEQGSSE